MSADRAAEGYDQVIRRIRFSETHPHVHIEVVTAPLWHWIATWVDRDDRQAIKTDQELRGLLDKLDVVDWATEQPKPPPVQAPPDNPVGAA